MASRVGWGLDAHRFGGEPPLLLAGVVVAEDRGVEAHSDGDVVAHALCDAVLGAAALGDLGAHFPSSDDRWREVDSLDLLRRCLDMSREEGLVPEFADVTVIAQDVRVADHRTAMRRSLAGVLGLPVDAISVKATTTDHMGVIGRGEGIAAVALVTMGPAPT